MWRGVVLTGLATLALSASALAATEQQISVNGTGSASVSDGASNAAQQVAYNQALSAAIGNAQSKAQAVAQQLSLALGPVLNFTEESDDYLGYCGIGFAPVAASPRVSENASAPVSAGASSQLTPIPAKPKKHKAKKKAHKAQSGAETCQLEADVTLVYLVG
jgi:uncharacterized protein YggE